MQESVFIPNKIYTIYVINLVIDYPLIELWSVLLLSTPASGKDKRPARFG